MSSSYKHKNWLSRLAAMILVFFACSLLIPQAGICMAGTGDASKQGGEKSELTVTFLDVGQGSAVLAESDGHYMMIDGGPGKRSSYVVSYLKKHDISRLDYIVTSHYDEDHISGLVGVLNKYEVGTVLQPDYAADTKIYESYRKKIKANGCEVIYPELGDVFELGSAEFTIVGPAGYDHEKANDNSIGIRLALGQSSFLMMGDTEWDGEYELLDLDKDKRPEFDSDVLLLSHHGSSGASSERFLDAVDASSYVISVGAGNSYGHPAEETMERIEDRGADLYRTDLMGEITAVSDGKKITFDQEPCQDYSPGVKPQEKSEKDKAEKETALIAGGGAAGNSGGGEAPYIGNRKTKKFHYASCGSVDDMNESNKVEFYDRQDALDQGYVPCKRCNP